MSDMRQISDDLGRSVATKLTELQGAETDTAFARRLGCTREHWSNVKTGRRRASYELIKRAGRVFPEMQLLVMRDLMGEPAEAAS
jgi:hypothetical protein